MAGPTVWCCWSKIRHLFSTGVSKREVARLAGVWRGTVDRALTEDREPTYHRAPGGSSFDGFVADVRRLLAWTPTMPAATIAERVGWAGSESLFRAKVAEIGPDYAVPDPADRLVHPPGFQIQCDLWFPHEDLPLGYDQQAAPPVLAMTLTNSGFLQARMLPTRTTPDLLGGIWSLIEAAGAVCARLTWENEAGIGRGRLTDPAVKSGRRKRRPRPMIRARASRRSRADCLTDLEYYLAPSRPVGSQRSARLAQAPPGSILPVGIIALCGPRGRDPSAAALVMHSGKADRDDAEKQDCHSNAG